MAASFTKSLTLALTLVAQAAAAAPARFGWRALSVVDGHAPPRIESAMASHLAVVLRPLGFSVVDAGPFDAQGGASCAFEATGARCLIEVVRVSDKLRAERRSVIPFRDAEDLAESLALLIADTLQVELGHVPGSEPGSHEPEPPPTVRTPPPDIHLVLPPTVKPKPPAIAQPKPSPPQPGRTIAEAGFSTVFGVASQPVALVGGELRVLYAGGAGLRAGGMAQLVGTTVTTNGYHLGIVRTLLAPVAGAGFRRGRYELDVVGGPALILRTVDAHVASGQHTFYDFDFMATARGAVILGRGIALSLAVTVDVARREEDVDVGSPATRLTSFGPWSIAVGLGLGYRR
jgi:hypothetical protein